LVGCSAILGIAYAVVKFGSFAGSFR
jgi:hypothetical protein